MLIYLQDLLVLELVLKQEVATREIVHKQLELNPSVSFSQHQKYLNICQTNYSSQTQKFLLQQQQVEYTYIYEVRLKSQLKTLHMKRQKSYSPHLPSTKTRWLLLKKFQSFAN